MQTGKFLLNEKLRVNGEIAELDQRMATDAPGTFKDLVCANSAQISTECGSIVGITVALIEGIIATLRIIWMMDLSSKEVQESLKDLEDSYELKMLITSETEAPQGRMHDEEWRKRE